jgi:hypothetical protein
MIGETTVMQTPFEVNGTPQSSRIRKAAQYGSSINDVVRILTEENNGLYTNDWLIGDRKTNETAILLLGTKRWKLWRSGKNDFPGNTEGFYWSVNNAKDPEVRKEYVPDPSNAPFDVVFSPVNRDQAFVEMYRTWKGAITPMVGMRSLGTSPLNRPHACDGKVTSSEMAEQLMFHAHYGKVTFRDKLPEKNSRLMPDLPNVIPHLSLGYTTFSPYYTERALKAYRAEPTPAVIARKVDLSRVRDTYTFPKSSLWHNTVYPRTESDNWFTSGSAAYWNILNGLPADLSSAMSAMRDQFGEMNARLGFTVRQEGAIAAGAAVRAYETNREYVVPRVRGTALLHQLRLILGNAEFSSLMKSVHGDFGGREMGTVDFLRRAQAHTGEQLTAVFDQWLKTPELPSPSVRWDTTQSGGTWNVSLTVDQKGGPFDFRSAVALDSAGTIVWFPIHVSGSHWTTSWTFPSKPKVLAFNPGGDIPVVKQNMYTLSNLFDGFQHAVIVYGTKRNTEFGHSAAVRLQTVLADAFTERFIPIRKDCEIDSSELAGCELVVIGTPEENSLAGVFGGQGLPIWERSRFSWQDAAYSESDDGMFLAVPNPWNPNHGVYWFAANSALETYMLLKRPVGLPGWARFKGEQIVEKGFH